MSVHAPASPSRMICSSSLASGTSPETMFAKAAGLLFELCVEEIKYPSPLPIKYLLPATNSLAEVMTLYF